MPLCNGSRWLSRLRLRVPPLGVRGGPDPVVAAATRARPEFVAGTAGVVRLPPPGRCGRRRRVPGHFSGPAAGHRANPPAGQLGQPRQFPGEAWLTLAADGGLAFAVRGFERNKLPSRYAADPKSNPPAFDLIRSDLPAGWKLGNREWVGIYELDGDKLTICYRHWSDLRPTEFRAEKDS